MKFHLDKKALLKMLNARNKRSHYSFTPDWFLGFLEAEGSFIGEGGNPPIFECSQHTSDYYMMCALRDWLGAGTVNINNPPKKNRTAVYTLRGPSLRPTLLALLSQAPLTPKITGQCLPWWKNHFRESLPENAGMQISPNWLAGFADGDGSFYTTIREQDDYRIGFQFQAVFDLSQKERGISPAERGARSVLLKNIASEYFSDWEKPRIKNVGADGMDRIRLVSAPYLRDRVLDLFKGRLQSRKEIQLALFSQAVEYIIAGQHLHPQNKREINRFVSRCHWIRDRHSDKCQRECNRILRERGSGKRAVQNQ